MIGGPFLPPTQIDGIAGLSVNPLSDAAMCAALAAGEHWATEVFYDRVEETVNTVLFRLLGALDIDREDLMQQALERLIAGAVWKRLPPLCSLDGWVALVTQQVAFGALRGHLRKGETVDRDLPTEARPSRKALLLALAQLKPARAEAVIMHDVLGYELQEISNLTSISPARARSLLLHGRKDLTTLIQAGLGKR
ncbi:MAG TPA: sigma factor-like helix-turn-helix DNA-binding protein [Polyangia bacterium]|jgi:DNA-directed RNA polymerase specialized sigma24 family protein|nr:sigma factor-like helix-turn-helix DNA-binding protein [Polyangia bacterium]